MALAGASLGFLWWNCLPARVFMGDTGSLAIGGMLGVVFNIDFRIAALAGYVGTDVLENVFKGVMPKSIILKKK